MDTEKLYKLGYHFVAALGDYDLFIKDNGGPYHDAYIRYHDNVNTKDKKLILTTDDVKAIMFTIEDIESSEYYAEDDYRYINRLLNI